MKIIFRKMFGIILVGLVTTALLSPVIAQHNSNYSQPISLSNQVPEWEKGTIWTYAVDEIDIEFSDDTYFDLTVSVHGMISEIPVIVEAVTEESYTLSFESKLQGEVSVETTIQSIPIKGLVKNGLIMNPHLQGSVIIRKSDLAIEEITLQFSGCFVARFSKPLVLPALRVPLKIEVSTQFSNPPSVIDFPIEIGNIWGITETTLSVNGKIESICLRPINFIHHLARFLNLIPSEFMETSDLLNDILPDLDIGQILMLLQNTNTFDIPETSSVFLCTSYEPVNVPAGVFASYKIQLPVNSTTLYYSPEIGNIVCIEGNIQQFLPYVENISMELISIQ